MKIASLGHVVVKVTDLPRAEQFYAGVLGLPVCARYDEDGLEMTFFSLGNHHDFAIMKAPAAEIPEAGPGLHHVAFNIGGSLAAGWLGDRYRRRTLLAGLYLARAIVMTAFLIVPLTATTSWSR